MTTGWQTRKLCEVSDTFDGPHATPKTVDSGPIYLGIGALQDGVINLSDTRHVTDDDFTVWTRRVRPQANDVVFSYETRIGQAAIIPDGLECCLGRRMGLIRFNQEKVIPRFFLYQYISPQFRDFLESKTIRGATVDRVSIKDFPSFPILVAPLSEQRRIVAILDEAFEAITAARTNAEQNRQNACALFESVLNSVEGKPAALGDYVTIKTGKLDANAAVEGGEYPFFTCSKKIYAIDKFAFDGEAILLAGNNAVGDFNVKHYRGKFNAYQRTYVITVNNEDLLLYRFLYFQMLKSLKRFKEQSVGAGTKFLKLGMIKDLKISLPSPQEQIRLVSLLDSVLEDTQRLESLYQRKIAALDELKQSLLQQAFSGQL